MNKTLLGLAIVALLLSGCKKADEAASTSPAASASRDAATTETAPAAAGFDIEKVPMSTATLSPQSLSFHPRISPSSRLAISRSEGPMPSMGETMPPSTW